MKKVLCGYVNLVNIFYKLLRSYGVDTSIHNYVLIYAKDSNYDSNTKSITIRFRAPGDYIAAFALYSGKCLAAGQIISTIFHNDERAISDFIYDIHNTYDLVDYATHFWVDDSIILLKNIDSNEIIYERYNDTRDLVKVAEEFDKY